MFLWIKKIGINLIWEIIYCLNVKQKVESHFQWIQWFESIQSKCIYIYELLNNHELYIYCCIVMYIRCRARCCTEIAAVLNDMR